jgi:large subunit ribosomal protein L3
MKFILGKKIEMTQVWKGEDSIAVTKIQVGPCSVIQVKNKKTDGYEAVQIGFGVKKEKNIKKPQKGHLDKASKANPAIKSNIRTLREFRVENSDLNMGDIIDVTSFKVGDTVKIVSTSKGKGFQGVVKRHGFHGQDKTHGHKDQERMPGSIGATANQRVYKGTRMGGRMGGDRVTIPSEVIEIDKENNVLYIKGGVPGARNSLVMISGDGELTPIKKSEPLINTESTEAVEKIEEVKTEPAVEEKK